MPPDYFAHPDLPGRQMFRCDRQRATLSTDACADLWQQAQKKNPPFRVHSCQNCPLGAVHAGAGEVSTCPLRGQRVCSRCDRSATRLIHDHVCVSCYNREREVAKGANGRGTAPIKHAGLKPRAVHYRGHEGVKVRARELTASTKELLVSVLRESTKPVMFGWGGRGA